jgi:cell shape-determining protein MreD
MIRLIPYLLYLWIVGMHQVFLSDVTSIYGVSINLPALMVLLVAIYKSEITALWFAFVVGAVAYAGLPQIMGWHVLILVILAMAVFHFRERINMESLKAKLLLVAGGIVLDNIAVLVLSRSDGFLMLLLTKGLPGVVYTALIAWLFFLFKEGRITLSKIKAIF